MRTPPFFPPNILFPRMIGLLLVLYRERETFVNHLHTCREVCCLELGYTYLPSYLVELKPKFIHTGCCISWKQWYSKYTDFYWVMQELMGTWSVCLRSNDCRCRFPPGLRPHCHRSRCPPVFHCGFDCAAVRADYLQLEEGGGRGREEREPLWS